MFYLFGHFVLVMMMSVSQRTSQDERLQRHKFSHAVLKHV